MDASRMIIFTFLLVLLSMGQTTPDFFPELQLSIDKIPHNNVTFVRENETGTGTFVVCYPQRLNYSIYIHLLDDMKMRINEPNPSLSPERNGYSIYYGTQRDDDDGDKECRVALIQMTTFGTLYTTLIVLNSNGDHIIDIDDGYTFTFMPETGDSSMDMGCGSGISGSGIDGSGISGSGIDGSGISGSGIDGSGISGSGIDGSGISGSGIDGSGISGSGSGIPDTDSTDITDTDSTDTTDVNGSGRSTGSHTLVLIGLCLMVLLSSSLH